MAERWFISDTHFGHANIMRFCPGRCSLGQSIAEHDENLMLAWNSVVGPKDIVYHLGDVAFGHLRKDLSWVKRLNGQIFLSRGNHDKGTAKHWASAFADLLPSPFVLNGMREVVLSHAPLHPMSMAGRWALNVHGHTHCNDVHLTKRPSSPKDLRYMNVSADALPMFRPVNLDVLRERVRQIVARTGPRRGRTPNLPGQPAAPGSP